VPGAPELKSLQVGVLPEAARPYRQQLLGFVLLDVVGRDLVKAELRLVVNEVRDPAVRLGERKLQIFHLAAPAAHWHVLTKTSPWAAVKFWRLARRLCPGGAVRSSST
jgi:hypothetical protein